MQLIVTAIAYVVIDFHILSRVMRYMTYCQRFLLKRCLHLVLMQSSYSDKLYVSLLFLPHNEEDNKDVSLYWTAPSSHFAAH